VQSLAAPFDLDQLWRSWTVLRAFAIAGVLADTYRDKQLRKQLKPEAIFEIETGLSLSGTDIAEASLIRSQWFAKTVDLFNQFDVLILPSSQVFPFCKKIPWPTHINEIEMSSYHRWMEVVVPASLIGIPALNVPAGFASNGRPMGMQLLGPRHSDLSLLQLGQQYHLATEWPQTHPPALS